jgi:hypothetical protein
MNYTLLFTIAGWFLAVVIFIFQEVLRRKSEAKFHSLEERNRFEAWHLYRTSFNIWSKSEQIKTIIDNLSLTNSGSTSHDLSQKVGEGYSLSVELTREIIKLIKATEPIYDKEKLLKWKNEGKIPNDYQLELFTILMNS